jgi:hypothetical protein
MRLCATREPDVLEIDVVRGKEDLLITTLTHHIDLSLLVI